jgi:hypothetical protein
MQARLYLLGILFKSEKDVEKTNQMRKKSLLSSKRMVQREPNYTYQVISYTNKGKTVSDFVIEESGKFITDLNIAVNRSQDIILTGTNIIVKDCTVWRRRSKRCALLVS